VGSRFQDPFLGFTSCGLRWDMAYGLVAWVVVGVGLMCVNGGMCRFGVVRNFGCGLLWFDGCGCVGFGCDVGCVGRNVIV